MNSLFRTSVSRRTVVSSGLAAGVGMALGTLPAAFAAEAFSKLPQITKAIPSTGEKVPVVGLGTNAYGVSAPEEIAARRDVLKNFPIVGAKIVDTARGYGESEVVIGQLLKELGNRDQLFIASKTPMRADFSLGKALIDESFKRLQVERIDLMQIHNFAGIDELFPLLQEYKQAKKVRYVGVTTSTDNQYAQMKEALQKRQLDFIQVDYSIDNRGAGDEILPMALDKGVAVLINVPLGGRRGNVLPKVAGKPLPGWAADIDATSWAQLFLKYNVSHPAVTAVIPGMTKLSHLQDNALAARGRLPDAATRKKIEQLWDSFAS